MKCFNIRWAATRILALLLLAGFGVPTHAQEYPSKDIRIVIGFAAGTGVDVIARFFANKLQPLAGKPVIVENKVGAIGNIGAEAVARARPDGYTMLIAPGNSTMASNPHLFKKLPFDPAKDFAPVSPLLRLAFTFGVAPSSPIKSMQELVAHLKAKGDKASYGVSGPFQTVSGHLFKTVTETKATAVRYRSTPDIHRDLLAGLLDYMIADAPYTLAPAKEGRLRLLAVATAERSSVAPDLPGMREAGVPGFDLSSWFGAWLPANTPPEIVAKVNKWYGTILSQEDSKAFIKSIGAEPFPGSPEVLRAHTVSETAKWGKLIRDAGLPQQ
ncbi:MAG: tripartite tricarboxylate transporter substrate binding protein [Rhizobiales bacterium]|nr:tripartite tricarboxylate transporter substrate binding protein [Hyphomicrobiales bacterium]